MDLLRHLRFFAAVADARHFGHAAQDLGMTPPPLSQGIQRLERHLGVRLFDRDARGVRLTAPGQHLLAPARDLLRAAEDYSHLARDLALPTQVRVGLCSDLGPLIPGLCHAVVRAGIDAVPEVAGSTELIDRLQDGVLDVAVVRHPGMVDGLVAGDVLRAETELVSAAGQGAGSLRDIDLPIVVPPRHHQPPAHDQLVDALRRAGHTGAVIESPDQVQRDALVAAGVAAQIRPQHSAPEDTGLPPLRVRVVLAAVRARRPEVEHHRLAETLTAALRQ
jgi:DNA-binding transcriptional LysR family regulator